MSLFSSDRTVEIASHSIQIEQGEAVIGRPETGVFIALPEEAIEIIEALASGATVGDARDAFRERHGETPDMDDLLQHLDAHGLIARPEGDADTAPQQPTFRDQFGWIPRPLARAFFSPPARVLYGLVIAGALLVVATRPSLLPGWRAAYFPRDTAPMLFGLMLLGLATTFFHELGHVLAARANGVATRFGIGNRLWFVVWETDMTGVWALPRKKRYLPILAGPLVDLISASILLIFLWSQDVWGQEAWWVASPKARQIVRALLLIYLLRLVWQAYFFVRTDYYYAITNALGAKRLMADTERFLKERWTRLRGGDPENSLEHLPAREQRAVRAYSVVWLVGRGAALSILLFVQLPLFVSYGGLAIEWLARGSRDAETTTWLPIAMFMIFFTAGMVMWLRPWFKRRRNTRNEQRELDAGPPPGHPAALESEI